MGPIESVPVSNWNPDMYQDCYGSIQVSAPGEGKFDEGAVCGNRPCRY
jgi:hypothetical protein